jgi:hypothetical protein
LFLQVLQKVTAQVAAKTTILTDPQVISVKEPLAWVIRKVGVWDRECGVARVMLP